MTDVLIKDVPDDKWEILKNSIPRSLKVNEFMVDLIIRESDKIKNEVDVR